MTDLRYIQDLLPVLKLHGVKHIKMHGLELLFHIEQASKDINNISASNDIDSLPIIADALKKQEEAMPPDLRADALMDQDRILNWSSPDQKPFEEDISLPLTDEQPL